MRRAIIAGFTAGDKETSRLGTATRSRSDGVNYRGIFIALSRTTTCYQSAIASWLRRNGKLMEPPEHNRAFMPILARPASSVNPVSVAQAEKPFSRLKIKNFDTKSMQRCMRSGFMWARDVSSGSRSYRRMTAKSIGKRKCKTQQRSGRQGRRFILELIGILSRLENSFRLR